MRDEISGAIGQDYVQWRSNSCLSVLQERTVIRAMRRCVRDAIRIIDTAKHACAGSLKKRLEVIRALIKNLEASSQGTNESKLDLFHKKGIGSKHK